MLKKYLHIIILQFKAHKKYHMMPENAALTMILFRKAMSIYGKIKI